MVESRGLRDHVHRTQTLHGTSCRHVNGGGDHCGRVDFCAARRSNATGAKPKRRNFGLAGFRRAHTMRSAGVCGAGASFPDTGGVYVFLKQIYSPALGFLWGWTMFFVMHAGILAAIAVVLARYLGYFFGFGDTGVRLLAMTAILLVSFVQYLGVKPGSAVQVVLTAAKVCAVALLCALIFTLGKGAHHDVIASADQPVHFASFGLAVAAGLFAFGGWHMVSYSAGETRNPERTIPRALILGVLIVTACYTLLNAAYLYVMPLGSVATSTRVAADAMERVLGPAGAKVITVVIIVSALGSLNGIALAGRGSITPWRKTAWLSAG